MNKLAKWWEEANPWRVGYTYRRNVLKLRYGLAMFAISIAVGTFYYFLFEDYTVLEGFYMAVITISTVGFTVVKPLSESGYLFTSIYIILNIGIFAYCVSAFSFYVIEGKYFKKMHVNLIENKIKELDGHIVICGYGRYGREVTSYFFSHGKPFVIIEMNEHKIQKMQASDEKFLYIKGDATQDEILEKANIRTAASLIAALPDDSDNVFTVLTARQLNPGLTIISRAYQERSMEKLKLAGANHVIMPELIGGFYMASLVTRPNAVEFFTYITNENVSDIGFEEIAFENLPDSYKNRSIRNLNLRSETGTNIIGFQTAQGEYIVNPPPDTKIEANCKFFVIGNDERLSAFRKLFNLKSPK